jgi:hypothetical protein
MQLFQRLKYVVSKLTLMKMDEETLVESPYDPKSISKLKYKYVRDFL